MAERLVRKGDRMALRDPKTKLSRNPGFAQEYAEVKRKEGESLLACLSKHYDGTGIPSCPFCDRQGLVYLCYLVCETVKEGIP